MVDAFPITAGRLARKETLIMNLQLKGAFIYEYVRKDSKAEERKFILFQTLPMKMRLRLPIITELKMFTTILKSCLKTKMLT